MKKAVKAVILILMSMGWIHAQSISISSPYPMMTWHTGEEYEIKWSSTGQMDNMVRIVLRRNDTPFRVIAQSESNDGSYTWTIPPDIPEGSYVMRVRTNPVQYPSVTGNSGTFFIKPPVVPKIEVYKPDGSSHWLKGQPYSIRWSQTKSLGQYVQIQLFKVDETTEVKLFPSLSAINNMGAYKWTVPLSVTPGNYKIKVRAMGTDVADFSAPFEIRGAEKFIAITEPEPWAGLCIGRNRTIRWASGGLQGTVNLELLTLAGKVAPTRSNVLVTGESGTGKELVARAIHIASDRKDMPFVSVNCMSLNPGVLESELFGHEKGSFTGAMAMKRGRFELAQGGTLFLDEIGELSQEMQVKLLRVLQERVIERVGGTETITVDFRLVAATNKVLQEEIVAGRFREDLFYRLNVVNIHLPPLRERREDIPILASHFLRKFSMENNREVHGFTPGAIDYLSAYEWPGNVRQLENVIERCVVLSNRDVIDVEDLPPELRDEEMQFKSAVDLLPLKINLSETLEKIEAALIRRALVHSGFVQVKTAEMLDVSKSLLQYKLKKYKITAKN